MSYYLVCSISGKTASEPVVCSLSGRVFEKSTLEKHIELHGTCPTTGSPMSKEDFVPIKDADMAPVAGSSTSKPQLNTLITKLREDYETASLETFALK